MDYLKGERSRDFIKHVMGISDAQLDAVLEYIALHKEAVEQEYTAMVCRSEERRAHYDKIFYERSPFPPEMSLEDCGFSHAPAAGRKISVRWAVS